MMFINKSNVARQVAVLEEDGFITRTPSAADKRVMELNPTEKTLELMPQLEEVVRQWDKIVTAGISEEDVQTVVRILDAMKANAAAWVNQK
jgi:DNA-binding MarR family transcriptional regulator